MNLRAGQMCVVDLGTGETSSIDMPDELSEETSAIAISERLHKDHPGSVILGTGVLTGTLLPAACAGIASCDSSDGMKTMPIMGSTGVELKLSGFDFLVITGVSNSPCYLWVRDGMAELVPADDMKGIDAWQRTEKIRTDQGDRKIQVLSTGPWVDASLKASAITVNHWLGEDESGIASAFGSKRLAAVAFRGMGELELSDPDAHWDACLSLRREHAERLGPGKGLASYTDAASGDEFGSLLHRIVGCYGCPRPCRSFLKVEEDPKVMTFAHKEPGYMHFDIPSIAEADALGLSIREFTGAMMDCAKHGADALSMLRECGADMGKLRSTMSSPKEISRADRASVEGSFTGCSVYGRALALGLCPRYWEKAGMDIGKISACAEPALGRPIE